MNLEFVSPDDAALHVVLDLPENGEHGDVGLTRTSWGRDEQVFTGVERNVKHNRLDSI